MYISPVEYLTPNKPGRLIKPKTPGDNNTTSGIRPHKKKHKNISSLQMQNRSVQKQFFVSAVRDWNHLDNNTVTATSINIFNNKINHLEQI